VYALDGGLPNEAYCLAKVDGKWEVYYSERGNKTGLKIFQKEEEACQYFYDSLIEVLKDMNLL
jgi:hypothetical protein